MKPTLAVLSLLGVAIAASGGNPLRVRADVPGTPGVSAAPASAVPGPFADKTILVYLDRKTWVPSHVLTGATIESIGGREFLVGVGADTKRPDDWRVGLKVRIAWSNVRAYMEFSPEEFEKFCANALLLQKNSKTEARSFER